MYVSISLIYVGILLYSMICMYKGQNEDYDTVTLHQFTIIIYSAHFQNSSILIPTNFVYNSSLSFGGPIHIPSTV